MKYQLIYEAVKVIEVTADSIEQAKVKARTHLDPDTDWDLNDWASFPDEEN